MRLAPLFLLVLFLFPVRAHAANVTVQGDAILVDGRPFFANGAAGSVRLDLLKRLGATVVRTYGDDPGPVLDAAQQAGLMVIAGFWMEHPRQGFDYRNAASAAAQLGRLSQMVTRYRHHPALLMWGIGNEVEAEVSEVAPVWSAIEEAARLVRRLDPNHPAMAVLAETGENKIALLKVAAPSIQVLGVNSYGGALPSLPGRVRAQGWTGPLIVTEMGPLGQWQAGRTPWGAAIEPSSDEKAALLARWMAALKPQVQGQIAFFWGEKQEVTPTWHSLLPGGKYTRTAEAMAAAWGGTTPASNRAPRIVLLRFPQGDRGPSVQPMRAELGFEEPDGDPVTVTWQVMAESAEEGKFGDAEKAPARFPDSLRDPGSGGVTLAGLQPGTYRLFVTLEDARGAVATANLPFKLD